MQNNFENFANKNSPKKKMGTKLLLEARGTRHDEESRMSLEQPHEDEGVEPNKSSVESFDDSYEVSLDRDASDSRLARYQSSPDGLVQPGPPLDFESMRAYSSGSLDSRSNMAFPLSANELFNSECETFSIETMAEPANIEFSPSNNELSHSSNELFHSSNELSHSSNELSSNELSPSNAESSSSNVESSSGKESSDAESSSESEASPRCQRKSSKPKSGSTRPAKNTRKAVRTSKVYQLSSGKSSIANASVDANLVGRAYPSILDAETSDSAIAPTQDMPISMPSHMPIGLAGLSSSSGSNPVYAPRGRNKHSMKNNTPDVMRRAHGHGSFKGRRDSSIMAVEKNAARLAPPPQPLYPRERDVDMSIEMDSPRPDSREAIGHLSRTRSHSSLIAPPKMTLCLPYAPSTGSMVVGNITSSDPMNSSGRPNTEVMSARAMSQQIKYGLPIILEGTNETTCITHKTMADVLNGEYKGKFSEVIIVDCRFPYEYNGGHIKTAINISTGEELARRLFRHPKPNENICIIFHCEFSSHRGPNLWKLLRNWDRNNSIYPDVNYPNMYVMHGGYEKFWNEHQDLCTGGYIKMSDKAYTEEMKRALSQIKPRRSSSMSNLRQSNGVTSPPKSALSPLSTYQCVGISPGSPIRLEMNGDLDFERDQVSGVEAPIPPRRLEYNRMVDNAIILTSFDDDDMFGNVVEKKEKDEDGKKEKDGKKDEGEKNDEDMMDIE